MTRDHVMMGWIGFMMAVILAGCATTPAVTATGDMAKDRPAPSMAPVPVQTVPAEGSLWCDTSDHLFVDPKARRVGDTVTVDIVENTTSKLDANTSASRTSSLDAGVEHLLGYMRALEEKNPRLNKDSAGSLADTLFKANLTNKFDGKGSSDRSGLVTASIGARVVEVLPNGNLIIAGKRAVKVNLETQYIIVSGIVRPRDIDSDNRVKSTYLADARIEYYGRGTLADKQRPGWFTRVLDAAWPF